MSKAVRVEGGSQNSVSAGLQDLGAWWWEGRSIFGGLRGLMRKMFRRNQPDPEDTHLQMQTWDDGPHVNPSSLSIREIHHLANYVKGHRSYTRGTRGRAACTVLLLTGQREERR